MKLLNNILAYLLSAVLALGTINPFALNTFQDEPSESIFLSLFSVLFMLVTFISYHKSLWNSINSRIVCSALILIGTIFMADIFYGVSTFSFYFYLKFLVVIIVFFSFILYFKKNPQMIVPCLLVFSVSCAILIFFALTTGLGGYAETYKGRLFLYGENPNSTSSRMSMALLFFSYLLFSKQYKLIWRLLFGVCILILFLYIIRSGSRGSFLVTLLGVALIFLSSRGGFGNKTIFVIIGISIIAWFLPNLMNNEDVALFERMEELQGHTSREDLMKQAFTIFMDNPIIGVGSNGYGEEKALRGFDHRDSHNIVTTILAMGGIVSFLAFAVLLLVLIKPTIRIRHNSITPLVLFLSMFLISMKTGGVITFVLMWYIYAVSYCWANSMNLVGKKKNK